MTPTRIPTLAAVAAVAGIITWVLLQYVYPLLPPLPWTVVATLGLLAVAEAMTAVNVRARVRGKPGSRPIEPMGVARMAALGKASAYMAAMAAGFGAGFLVDVVDAFGKEVPRHDTFVSGAALLAAVALAAAALFLERCCRVPKPPEERSGSGGR